MAQDTTTLPPIGKAEKVSVEILDFDENNPRFTPDKQPSGSSDHAIISMLAATADLSELIQSISTSGYINIEPLIVIERKGRLAVLEGNRRLAAVKALRDPELARRARISVPEMMDEQLQSLEELLVYRVATEDDARDLIGFKHINGPQSWDAFAKARFAARWLDSEHEKQVEGKPHFTMKQIASRMGDQHSTMHRMVAALYVLDQAADAGIYQIDDRKKRAFSFSHLYTGLSYEEFTDYLGMDRPNRSDDPQRNPVSPDKFDELQNILIWLYGSKDQDIEPVVRSQNPDLGRLRKVLASPAATSILTARHNLDEAISEATPSDIQFQLHLIAANAELQRAVATLDSFDPHEQPELQTIANSLMKRANTVKRHIDAVVSEAASE